MRVTQGMLSNKMLHNLMNSQSKMDTYLEQLYTGKKINRPSDDPAIAMKGMNYRTQVREIEQFKRNTSEVNNWMDNSDAALDKATKAMHRLRELATQASNSTNDDKERESIKAEVQQIKEHLIDIANTSVNGKYIFNGTETDTAPIVVDENGNLEITHNENPVMIEIFNGTKLQSNVNPVGLFDEDLFGDIDTFITMLESNGQTVGKSIEDIDKHTNKLINGRADLGARMNRLELIENRLEEQEVIAKKTMSDNEDVHFEEAITNLITQESLYRAALATGSRVIQPSLIDFLR